MKRRGLAAAKDRLYLRVSGVSTAMTIRITLYGRADCELCHEMRAVVDTVARALPLEVEEVDVDTDPELRARWGDTVPVLAVNGRPAFKVRVTAAALRERLARERR